jgi:GDPmannose 4,6-dehydratase
MVMFWRTDKLRAFVTGVAGFAGSHLAELLLREDYEVYGLIRYRSKLDNIQHIIPKLHLVYGDLRDSHSIEPLMQDIKPDYVFHLAAQSYVPMSWKAPCDTIETNVIGTINLFEAVRKLDKEVRIHFAGSSEEYGLVREDECPIIEEQSLKPLSTYGVSKITCEKLAYQYVKSYGMKIVCTRGFNHSVSKYTPIIIKDNATGLIDIKYISEIRDKNRDYRPSIIESDLQIWDLRKDDISVWSNNEWTSVKEISCHPIRDNKLVRVETKKGLLEVTDNHSIIGRCLEPLEVSKLNIGDKVATVNYPTSSIMYVNEETAWLLGFIVAEGCVTNTKTKIYNQDKALLYKAREILLKYFGQDSYFTEGSNCIRLIVKTPKGFSDWLYPQIYASNHNKRIPKNILNANKEAKLAFLEGYNAGDGLKKGYGSYKFKNFKTNSRILAAGLCFLISETTKQEININYEDRRTGYISINLNSDIQGHEYWGNHLRKMDGIIRSCKTKEYLDEVWDLSTSNGMFQAGVGNLLAHNTGPRRGEQFASSNFAKQIAEIENGAEPIIHVGNLQAQRDFTDVRDMVRAYLLAVKLCQYGVPYNVCSGRAISIESLLNRLLSLSKVNVEVVQDADRMRPSDVPLLLGDCTLFHNTTGWERSYSLDDTLEDLLNYWRENVRQTSGVKAR